MIAKHFNPIVGEPCWGVHWDPQVNLSMNFGRPHLQVREPQATRASLARVRDAFSHRLVTVRGDWWLWIFSAYWKLSLHGKAPIKGNSSRVAITRALDLLNGQQLTAIDVDPHSGRTTFAFDLGARLDIRRFSATHDVWTLYKPNARVLVVRGNGTFSYRRANEPDAFKQIG